MLPNKVPSMSKMQWVTGANSIEGIFITYFFLFSEFIKNNKIISLFQFSLRNFPQQILVISNKVVATVSSEFKLWNCRDSRKLLYRRQLFAAKSHWQTTALSHIWVNHLRAHTYSELSTHNTLGRIVCGYSISKQRHTSRMRFLYIYFFN